VGDVRQPSGLGFAVRDPLPWTDLARIVRAGETLGYSALFLPEITGRDALVALGALAGETSELLLGTGIVPIRSRTTMLTAMAAATVHERSGGRLILGLGTGDLGRGALDALREEVHAIRALLSGETVERRGARERLSLDLGSPVPIWISALGPRAMRLAGEVADGVLLNWCPPDRVAFARDPVREGAEAADRDPSSVAFGVYVRTSVVEGDAANAITAVKAMAGQYASYAAYGRQFVAVGLGEEAAIAAEAHRAGDVDAVPEGLVRAVCAVGDPSQVRDRLDAYTKAGADVTVAYPVPVGDPVRSILGTLTAVARNRA
jgi:alkanesulfonate monooxygenase SsuD/methylene tetrahydromethanopterin reductase-like flavin-dependent oxidoreductase (luciferase family)